MNAHAVPEVVEHADVLATGNHGGHATPVFSFAAAAEGNIPVCLAASLAKLRPAPARGRKATGGYKLLCRVLVNQLLLSGGSQRRFNEGRIDRLFPGVEKYRFRRDCPHVFLFQQARITEFRE